MGNNDEFCTLITQDLDTKVNIWYGKDRERRAAVND